VIFYLKCVAYKSTYLLTYLLTYHCKVIALYKYIFAYFLVVSTTYEDIANYNAYW